MLEYPISDSHFIWVELTRTSDWQNNIIHLFLLDYQKILTYNFGQSCEYSE